MDEYSGSCNFIDLPINGYKALAEHFRTGAMEISSDELGDCNKPFVSGSLPNDHWINEEIEKLAENCRFHNYTEREIELGKLAFKQGYVVTWQYANKMRQ